MTYKILETVKIVYGDGFLRINKSAFDPKEHTLFGAEPAAKESDEPVAEPITEDGDGDSADERVQREEELKTESWQTLKSLAAELDPPITAKPENGWDEVIPLILAKEFD